MVSGGVSEGGGLVGLCEGLGGEEHGHFEDEDFLDFVFGGRGVGVEGGGPLELHALGEADGVVLLPGREGRREGGREGEQIETND